MHLTVSMSLDNAAFEGPASDRNAVVAAVIAEAMEKMSWAPITDGEQTQRVIDPNGNPVGRVTITGLGDDEEPDEEPDDDYDEWDAADDDDDDELGDED